MLKFVVVVYRRPGMSSEEFRRHFEEVHGPLARKLPGLRRYWQNFPQADAKRKPPDWDAVIELYFDDWEAMEAAWATREGAASDEDLKVFTDGARTTWSVVEEVKVLP